MNIIYFFKKVYEFRITKWILFFTANLMLVYMISFMFWAGIVTADPVYAGIGRIVDGSECPNWSWEIKSTDLSFEEVFIMFAGMYFGMIFIAIIAVVINHRYQIMQADDIR